MLVWWLGAVALFVAAAAISLFNELVAARNQVRSAWSDIDVQLTRRHDLVPQLVAAVQGYAGHERATLALITELRTRAMAAASLQDKAQLEGELAQRTWLVRSAARDALDVERCPTLWREMTSAFGPWFRLLAEAPDDTSPN